MDISDILCPCWMDYSCCCCDFGDSLTLPLVAPAGQIFHLCSGICQHPQDELGQVVSADTNVPLRVNPNDAGDP